MARPAENFQFTEVVRYGSPAAVTVADEGRFCCSIPVDAIEEFIRRLRVAAGNAIAERDYQALKR